MSKFAVTGCIMYDFNDLLSIGEMAKLCRLSIKTLRYFDKTGTVKPAYIDPATQYRYYSKTQLPFILVVRELRLAGYSLADIRKISEITEINQYAAVLDEKLVQIEMQMKKLQKFKQQYTSWKKYLDYLKNTQYDSISVKYLSPRTVLFTRFQSEYEYFALSARIADIHLLMHDNNLYNNGPIMAVFHDNDRNFDPLDADIEIGIEVLSPKPLNYPFIKEIPSGLYASVIHQGRFETLMTEIYPVLHNWIKEHHYQAAGPAIQVYLWPNRFGQHPENLITEVQIPVKTSDKKC